MAPEEGREQLVGFGKKLFTLLGTINLLLGILLTISNFVTGLRLNFRLSLIIILLVNLFFLAGYLYYLGWSQVDSPIRLPDGHVRKKPHFPRYYRAARVSLGVLGALVVMALLAPPSRGFVIDSLVLPPAVPLPPASEKLYYMTVVDASQRMLDSRGESGAKWEVAIRSLRDKISILPSGANFGLVTFGQEGSPSSRPCRESAEVLVPVTGMKPSAKPEAGSSQQEALSAAAKIKPGSTGSLTKAISLAVDQLMSGLPDTYSKTIIVVTGGGDGCDPQAEWDSLEFLLSQTIKGLDLYTELIVFADEEVKEEILSKVTKIDRLENVTVSLPTTAEELNRDLESAVDRAIERGMKVDPTPFVVQATIVAVTRVSQPVAVDQGAPEQPPAAGIPVELAPTITQAAANPAAAVSSPTTIIVTATSTPTLTPTRIPPTNTPSPVPPTSTFTDAPPPTETPTDTPAPTETAAPYVVLSLAGYEGTGEGCSAVIAYLVTGSPATGQFRVWNQWYSENGMAYDPGYEVLTLSGQGTYNVGLGGKGNPSYYRHKAWFEYNGTTSNILGEQGDLICPGLTPSP